MGHVPYWVCLVVRYLNDHTLSEAVGIRGFIVYPLVSTLYHTSEGLSSDKYINADHNRRRHRQTNRRSPVSNLSRKLIANLDFRARKQAFWRRWSGEPRRKLKGPPLQRKGNKEDGYQWFRHRR